MVVRTAVIRLYAPWVSSLKDKRSEVKSLIARTRARFNVSVAEVDEQDTHRIIVLGLACAAESAAFASQAMDAAVAFIERSTEAQVVEVLCETR